MRWLIHVCLVLFATLACHSALIGAPSPSARQKAVDHAEYLFAQIQPLPPKVFDPGIMPDPSDSTIDRFENDIPSEQYHNALVAFKAAVKSDSHDPRAYFGLAQCQQRLGMYRDAASTYRSALALSPADPGILSAYHVDLSLLALAHQAGPHLPHGQRILQIEPIDIENQTRWLVLSAEPETDGLVSYANANLSLFEPADGELHRLWTSRLFSTTPVAGGDTTVPGIDQFFTQLYLVTADVYGNGEQEACVLDESSAASAIPSHLDIFSQKNGILVRTFQTDSVMPIWIQDIDNDGRREIGTYSKVGDTLPGYEMPTWMDIYAVKNGKYELANADFPTEFRTWPAQLKQVLRTHPGDPDVLRHLGKAYAILGERQNAIAAYNAAVTACRKAMHSNTDRSMISAGKAELLRIEQERSQYETAGEKSSAAVF